MHKLLRLIAYTLICLLAPLAAMAQVATGTYTYGTFDNLGLDTVNVGNLNVHLNIPVLNKAGRGMSFYYDMSYDSSVWVPSSSSGTLQWQPTLNWGWRGATEVSTGYISMTPDTVVCSTEIIARDVTVPNGWRTTISNVVYHDPWGVAHSFTGSSWIQTSTCGSPTSGGTIGPLATDGSGYQYESGTIYDKNNKKITPPSNSTTGVATVIDGNGNEISVDGSGHFTDTTGNVALTVAGVSPSPETFTYTDTNGNSQTVTMTYTTYTVQTAFGCSGVAEYGPTSTSLVSAITFPDGSTYNFTYEATPGVSGNVTGRLASVELPQGGSIDYAYSGGSHGIECSDGSAAILTRTLAANAGSAASTLTYTRSITGTGTSQTAVVDGLGNHKTYDFVEASNQPTTTTAAYYETSRTISQGTSTTVLARNTCYNAESSPCATTIFSLPISQIDTYETLNGSETHGATTKYNTYGAVTETDAYDYASGASRGSLLRKEEWTYGYSIANLPTLDEVFDGSGNLAGKTTYTYDGTTPTASSGVPQHVSVTGARGNLTSETVYASSGTSYSLSATYEDTGSLLTSVTPSGTTTLSYDSTFVYSTGAALPTPSSGIAIGGSESYDTSYTGLPQSSTDPNSQATKIPTYDSRLRVKEIEYPDGGETIYNYDNPNQTGIGQLMSGSVWTDTEVLLDSYARQSRVAIGNGQSSDPYYQTDTCYDGNGNVSFVSYRYQGTGWGTSKVCSGSGGDTYSYDVLGRVLKLTRGNGETRTYTYTGRATEFTDENSVQRISQIDGLGRTTIVCEISSSTLQGVAPVSCGTDITGATGFTTTYAYALATGTTTVTQGAQTRVFKTDWLGRTTSVQEPESGTTTYSYAYNSNGLVVTRKRPTANQTSTSTLTTTTTQYDSLSRPVTITYTDGTPTKYYYYDTDSYVSWSSETTTNLKGRLAIASTSIPGTLYTSSLFSYDAIGRPLQIWECAPSTCSTSAQTGRSVSYSYDLAGNVTAESDGASGNITYNRSIAGEVTSIINQSYSLTGGGGPATLVSNVQNGPNGPISYALGNGLGIYKSYDSLGRLNGSWVCTGTAESNCSTQIYGNSVAWTGVRATTMSDTALGITANIGYDEFNRLTSRIVTSGTVQNYTYVYDRYGNRWQQNALQGGASSQLSFNASTNQINTSGYTYDAAGNMTNDGFHAYTYDAEGNITAMDGSAETYVYDALNHKVRYQTASYWLEFLFDAAGRITSNWPFQTAANEGHIFWDGAQIAFRSQNALTYFEHKDWLQTDRMHTDPTGAVAATYTSLPFGDGKSESISESYGSWNFEHFGDMDYDSEDATHHAQYRQYNDAQGRWMRPDPYLGSYDFSNPQSMNRYVYVLNNPLSGTDSLGLECDLWTGCGNGDCANDPNCSSGDGGDGGGGGGGGGGGYGSDTDNGGSNIGSGGQNVTVCGADGSCYTYSAAEYYQIVAGGLGSGITVDAAGDILCGDNTICGSIYSSGGFFQNNPYIPNVPNAPSKGQTWKEFGQAAKSCAASSFGLSTAAAGGAVAAGTNALSTAGKFAGMTPGTSAASSFFRAVLPQAIESTWAPTLMNPLATSGVLGGVVGRWVPVVGEAILVVQGGNFVSCLWASDDNY